MSNKLASIGFELTFDGSKMMSRINASCEKVKNSFEKSFKQAGSAGSKAVETANADIQKILNNTSKSAKSKAASIASIYKKEGLSASEAMAKAWKNIERDSSDGAGKVKRHLGSIRNKSKNVSTGMRDDFSSIFPEMSSLAKKAGIALAAAFSVKKLVDFGKGCIELGSDLAEVQNVVDVTFPKMTAQVDKFAKSAATSFGLSETMAKKYAGTFGAMAKAFGFSEDSAYNMSTALTGLAGDVASFYNISQDEAYTKLKSVFTGETETLKDLGVVMTQNALDQFALAQGIGKTTKEMSEAEKVALRYKFVTQQLSTASGDFARTSGSWANQVRVLKLQFDSLRASIGQGLINVLTPVIQAINVLLGKLVTLANAFKSFTELITGNKSSGSTGGVAGLANEALGASDGLEEASESADNLSDSTSGVGKAAKKAAKEMRALMGFDAINKLADNSTDNNDSDSGSPSSAGGNVPSIDGAAVDFGNLAKGETELDKLGKKFDPLLKRAKELANLFKKGFKIGFGDSEKKITSIKKHLDGIRKSLKEIAADKDVVEAVNGWLDAIALNAGKIAGSMVSIGLTIADNLVGGFDKYLEKSKGFIKERIISILDTRAEMANIAGDFAVAFANVFDIFSGENAKNCTASLIGIFSDGFWGAIDLGLKFQRDILDIVTAPFIKNQDKIKTAIDNTLGPISIILDTFHQSVKSTFEKIFQVYDTYIQPFLTSVKTGCTEIVGLILDGYNTHIAPVLEKAARLFDEIYRDHLQPMIEQLLEVGGKVFELLQAHWETIMKPFLEWLISILFPAIAKHIETATEILALAVGAVADLVTALLETLGGIITFLTGVFTGDWKKAWEGVKQIFKGVWDAIKTVFKSAWSAIKTVFNPMASWFSAKGRAAFNALKNAFSGTRSFFSSLWSGVKSTTSSMWEGIKNAVRAPVNGIIGIFNHLMSGAERVVNGIADMFNSIRIDIPDWVPVWGGGTLGFNLPTWSAPQIPYLAQGGYVKPNTPQLAMIGDNLHQGEIVAPEGKLQAMVDEAVAKVGGGSGITRDELEAIMNRAVLRIVAALANLGFVIDSQEIAKAKNLAQTALDRRFNNVELT